MTKVEIHPTAVVDNKAELGSDVSVGPYCIVGSNVSIEDNVTLHSHIVIDGHTTIGANTNIFPFASLGTVPQDMKYGGEQSQLVIGKNNTIREHVTMNPGTQGGGMKTIIGDNCLFMVGAHVAHDCILGSHVIMANNATLGGHVIVGDHVLIGGLAAVHQFVRIGSYAVIGGMCGVGDDVIPFGRARGERAHLAGLNLVGLERGGFDKDQIKRLQQAFQKLFTNEGNFDQRVDAVAQEYHQDSLIMEIINFSRDKGKFGLCQPESKAA